MCYAPHQKVFTILGFTHKHWNIFNSFFNKSALHHHLKHLAQNSIIIYGSSKVRRSNPCWVQEFVNMTKLWQFFSHMVQQLWKQKNQQKILLSFSCFYDIGQAWLPSCYGPLKVNMFLQMPRMVPKHQSPSYHVMLHILKFRIKITLNQRLKEGFHCADFFLQDAN